MITQNVRGGCRVQVAVAGIRNDPNGNPTGSVTASAIQMPSHPEV